MAEENIRGQGQIPREVAVVRSRKERSEVWEHFTRFTTADGEDKAKCKYCSAVLAADTKTHGTGSLRTHHRRHRTRGEIPREVAVAHRQGRRVELYMAEGNTGGQDQIPREVAVVRRRNTRSEVREHFTRFTTADGKAKAKCNNCSAELVVDTKKHGTQYLWRHVKSCSEQATDGTRREHPPRPRAASESSNLNPDDRGACENLARMIALHGYDSSVVEDVYFKSFVKHLNPDFQVPSRRTIEEICDGVSDEAKRDLSSKLEHTSGRVNLALGTAQTVEGTVYYIACHFIDDEWKLHKMIIGAYMVVPRYIFHGSLLGIPEICLEDYGSSACDGGVFVPTWDIEHKVFSMAIGNDDYYLALSGWDCDWDHFFTEYTDDALRSIAKRLMDHVEDIDTVDNFLLYPSLTRQERQEILSYLGLDELWTYNEHWYSFYCSLEVVHRGRSSKAAEDATRTRQQLFEETALTELLRKLFGAICRAIQTISAPSSPTSNLCLRELFKVREVLQSALEGASGDKADVYQESNGFDEDVADVLKEAKCLLDEGIEDSYVAWSVPLVLDPRYKLKYITFSFNKAFGLEAENYISEVTREIERLFTDYSEVHGETTDGDQNRAIEMAVDNSDPLEQAWEEHCRQQQVQKELEHTLLDRSELDRYLQDDLVPNTGDFDILNWWKVNSSKYPTVATMARGALAMATCSTTTAEQISRIRSMVRGYSKEVFEVI